GAGVEVRAAERVEGEGRRGRLDGGALDVGVSLKQRPLLEEAEARAGVLVEHDDLAVEDEPLPVAGEGGDGLRDLGERRRRVPSVAKTQLGVSAVPGGEKPEAVVLELPDPPRPGERGRAAPCP